MGFYARFRGGFISGLYRQKSRVLFVVIVIIDKLTADLTAIYFKIE